MQKEDKQFIYYWYKEFGWKSNPFEKRLLEPINNFISGYEKERRKLNYFVIDKLPVVIINGKEGYGKTTLLLWLKEELNKYKGVVIVDYISKEINFIKFINTLLDPILTFKEKLAGFGSKITTKSLGLIKDNNLLSIYNAIYFKKVELDLNKMGDLLSSRLKGRPLVLIVDDFNSLDEKLISLLKILLESDINIQIAIASEQQVEKVSKKEHIKINLDGLNLDECKDMLSKRIIASGGNGLNPFTQDIISVLYKKSKGCPLTFLELCREKAVNLALNNLNIKKGDKITQQKQENISPIQQEAKKQETSQIDGEKKNYEIKVMNPKPENSYNIIVEGDKKKEKTPKKLERKKIEAKRIK